MSTYAQPNMDLFEPDDEWKQGLKARIKLSSTALIDDAKKRRYNELRMAANFEDRKWVADAYNKAREDIKKLEKEQYNSELEKERSQRRWIAEKAINTAKTIENAREEVNARKRSPEITIRDRMTPKASYEKAEVTTLEIQSQLMEKARLEEELLRIKQDAEAKREEARRQAEEAHMKMESTRQKEAEVKMKEMEILHRELDAKKRSAEAKRLEDDAKRKEIELRKKEEAARQREEILRKELEQVKEMKQEAEKIAEREQMRILLYEAETRKRAEDIQVRERYLHLREMDFRRREEDAKKMEVQEKEAEAKRREDATRSEKTQVDAQSVEEVHKDDAAVRIQKVEDSEIEQEPAGDQMDQDAMIAEAVRRSQDPMCYVPNLNDNISDDSAVQVKRQAYILQQLKYEQQANEIQRKRQEERFRKESFDDPRNLGPPSTSSLVPSLSTSPPLTGTKGGTSSSQVTNTLTWSPPTKPTVAPYTSSTALLQPPSATYIPHRTSSTSALLEPGSSGTPLQSTQVPSLFTGVSSTDTYNGAFTSWGPTVMARSISADPTLAASTTRHAGVSRPPPSFTTIANETADILFPNKFSSTRSVSSDTDRFGAAPHTVPTQGRQRRENGLSIGQQERFRREQESLDAKAVSHSPTLPTPTSSAGPRQRPNDTQIPSAYSPVGTGTSKLSPQLTRPPSLSTRPPLVNTHDNGSPSLGASHAIWVKSTKPTHAVDETQETALAAEKQRKDKERWQKAGTSPPKVWKAWQESRWEYERQPEDVGFVKPMSKEERDRVAAFRRNMPEPGREIMASDQRKETANRRKRVHKRKGPNVTIEDISDEDMDNHRGGTLPSDSRVLFEEASNGIRDPGDA